MVLFIQHHAEPVLDQDRGPRADSSVGIEPCELLADQMPLMQQLPIATFHPVKAKLDCPPEKDRITSGRLHRLQNVLSFGLRVPPLIDPPCQIARQANPRREHQVAGRTTGVEPADASISQQAEVDHSITRSRSRSSAASS